MIKTSIRFFEDIPIRAVFADEDSKWWFCAVDIAEALTKSKNPRSYWNALKRRHDELSTICRQLKLTARDGKSYLSDKECTRYAGVFLLHKFLLQSHALGYGPSDDLL